MDYSQFHLAPKSARHDVSTIGGNLTPDELQLVVNVWEIALEDGYSSEIGHRVQFKEINVTEEDGGVKGQVVAEITVTDSMANPWSILHGACSAFLVDMITTSTFLAVAVKCKKSGMGLSQSLSMQYLHAVPVDSVIRIVSTTVVAQGRRVSARCDGWDTETNKLIFTADHVKVHPFKLKL